MITWDDFEKVEIRVGTIVDVKDFPEAKKPMYKLKIDFGEHGVRNSGAQLTKLYKKEDLLRKQVIAVMNFPIKQIANFVSEVLVLGFVLDGNEVVLLHPERNVQNGLRVR